MSASEFYNIFGGLGDAWTKRREENEARQAAQSFADAYLGTSGQPQQQNGLLSNLGRIIGIRQAPQASPAGPSLASLGQAYMPQQQEAPAPAPAMQAINRVAPPEQIRSIIEANVPAQDREYYSRLIGKESSFNPSAISPTGAAGLGQFTRGTGRQYGLIDASGDRRTDPVANVQATVRLTEDNRRALTDALGRPPTYGELALAHQQGAAGAISLLRGGAVPEQNLAVNNAGGMTGQAAANKIMAYYNMPGSQQAAPAQAGQSAPVQVAQAGGGMPSMPAQQQQRFTPEQAQAIRGLLANPQTRAQGMMIMQQVINPQSQFGFQMAPDGTLIRTNNRTGSVEAAFQTGAKPTWGVIGEDQFGNKQYGWTNPQTMQVTPGAVPQAAGQPAPQGDAGQGIPPAPPGVDPKVWRQKQTEQLVQGDKYTEQQSKDALFADRMRAADKIIGDPTITSALMAPGQVAAANIPLVGNYAVSEPYQKGDQASRDFINAVLRKESGAVISDAEFANAYKQYLPRPGDSAATLRQKAANRRTALEGIARGAGPSYQRQQSKTATPEPPKVGDLMDGYRFKGGDPSKPEFWVRVQ